MDDALVYTRLVLYLVGAMLLIMFASLHRDRPRRFRNLSLAIFFLTIVVSLVARLVAGLSVQRQVNDLLTTPALVVYVIALAVDFYFASVNDKRP